MRKCNNTWNMYATAYYWMKVSCQIATETTQKLTSQKLVVDNIKSKTSYWMLTNNHEQMVISKELFVEISIRRDRLKMIEYKILTWKYTELSRIVKSVYYKKVTFCKTTKSDYWLFAPRWRTQTCVLKYVNSKIQGVEKFILLKI